MTNILNKKFFFVRHGQTEWNSKKLCQGHLDIELNETGRQEAKDLAEKIKDLPFSTIYTSPLKRALETAMILHNSLPHCNFKILHELKERSWGELEGFPSAEMYRFEEMEEKNPHKTTVKGVEDRETFKSRVLQGLNIALQSDESPLIISHGRFFLMLCQLLNAPVIKQIPNATLIECQPSTDGWQINFIK